jgi:23S rRNA G2445 N2-methylase RlmL
MASLSRPRIPLTQAVLDPGFTPSARDLDALIDLLGDDELVKAAERAIGRLGEGAVVLLRQRFDGSVPPLRARVLRAIGRFPADPGAREALIAALTDADPKTRRNAAMALGHVEGEPTETALLAAWQSDPRPEMRRTIAASLGKVGGARSASLLDEASTADDPELARIAAKAAMMVGRTTTRADRGLVEDTRAPDKPVDVELLAREGLEELLSQELLDVPTVSDVRVTSPGHVRARLAGPLRSLFAARTMLSFGFPLPTEWTVDGETLEEVVARAVTSEAARAIFATFTKGAVRYRLAWQDGGHRRATTWSTAQAIAKRAPELVNDPTSSLWEVVVAETRRFVDVSLAPRGLSDPRFEWRKGDVPAASHPTIAAALARVAGVRDGDVVWDPFVGSGSELVERARLGPYRSLHGSDVEPRALAAARKNLDAAGLQAATLEQGDVLSLQPPSVTLIITNPPMGRRASRERGLVDALDRFVEHAATVLAVGGRLVWITPWAERGRAAAARSGLSLEWARPVDMGGFDAEMQRFVRVR